MQLLTKYIWAHIKLFVLKYMHFFNAISYLVYILTSFWVIDHCNIVSTNYLMNGKSLNMINIKYRLITNKIEECAVDRLTNISKYHWYASAWKYTNIYRRVSSECVSLLQTTITVKKRFSQFMIGKLAANSRLLNHIK